LSQRCRNRLEPASAYATAAPRAPDGTQSPYRCHRPRFDCALPPVSKRQFVCVASRRGLHRGTEAPRRSGRDPTSSRIPLPLPRAGWPGCLGIARCTLVPDFLCERRNENAPGMASEGIRGSSEDRSDRSSAGESRSGLGVRAFVRKPRAQARIALWQRWHQAVGDVIRYQHGRSTVQFEGTGRGDP